MIYLNNAATTYPKPQCVLNAHAAALCKPPQAQFRSGAELKSEHNAEINAEHNAEIKSEQNAEIKSEHNAELKAEQNAEDYAEHNTDSRGDIFDRCRKAVAGIMGIRKDYSRIFFSSGATDSANRVLYGLLSAANPETESGKNLSRNKIITTVTEHNSILRPLYNHPEWKKNLVIAECDNCGRVSPDTLDALMAGQTGRVKAVIVNHCSNVTGMVQNLHALSEIAHRYGALFIADVSQSAGCMQIDADENNIDALIFTGHKGLFGVQGTGGYYVRKGLDFIPLEYGGTGRNSSQLQYTAGDYEYEVGTQNEPGIAALCAGAEFVQNIGIDKIAEKEQRQIKLLYEGLTAIDGIRIYGSGETNIGPVISCNVEGMKPSDTTYILQNAYGITVRTGLHCAPLIHRYIGSAPFGTIRASISAMTTDEDINAFLAAIREIAVSVRNET